VGFLLYNAACALGALANLAVSGFLFSRAWPRVAAVVVGALVGLILIEPDFGTAMTLAVIAAVMVFAAGLSYTYVFGTILLALPLVAASFFSLSRSAVPIPRL